MRVIVAAEDSGSLKDISVSRSGSSAIETFAAAGRPAYVQRMTVVRVEDKQYVCVARKGGTVQLYDAADRSLRCEWRDARHAADDAFVGLQYVAGKLCSCTTTGKLAVREIDGDEHFTVIGEPVNAFRVHPRHANVIAFGGKDRELEIDVLDFGKAVSRRKVWRARNVKNDELNLRVPVWISDIRFLDTEETAGGGGGGGGVPDSFRLVICTRFGHVRLYETRLSRKPILSVEVGEHPLVALAPYLTEDEIVYCDTHSTTARFNLLTGKPGGHYAGSAGAVLSLDSTAHHDGLLATAGLDRFLRVYNLRTRKLKSKVFVGAKLSCVCILSDAESESESEAEADGDEADGDEADEADEAEEGVRRRKRVKVEEDVWEMLDNE